jgi:hypothetical protein
MPADLAADRTPQAPRSPRAATPAYPSPVPSLGSSPSIRYVSSWRRSPRSRFAILNLKPSGLRRSTPAPQFQQRQGHSDLVCDTVNSRNSFGGYVRMAVFAYRVSRKDVFIDEGPGGKRLVILPQKSGPT